MATIAVTEANFEAEVFDSDIPVLVDFWADWCGPCKQVAPVLEEVSETFAGKLKITKVDVDACPNLAGSLRIQSIPTLMLFENGRPTQATAGAMGKAALEKLLAQWLPALELTSTQLSVEALAERLEGGAPTQIWDLREPRHFARSHLRHARCVEPEQLDEALAEVPPGTLTVLICRTGEVSEQHAERLAKAGHTVAALEKGLLEWEGSLRPTYSNREEEALDASGGG